MTLAQYQARLGKLSAVKRQIISELWNTGGPGFPRQWVKSSKLLALTGQKYFDRRTRELRDELGCAIETQQVGGEHCYRLVSEVIGAGNRRAYLSATEKNALFRQSGNRCQVCGLVMSAGVRGLQADHKVPLNRGGGHERDNWQALCNECNVAKRRACAGCEESCRSCPWAYPESTGRIVALRLSNQLMERLENRTGGAATSIESTILQILDDEID